VLSGIITGVVADMARDLLAETRALDAALVASDRELARSRFLAAALAWKRAQTFRSGPFVTSQAFQRAAFWPPNEQAIDAVLAAPALVDTARVQGLGVDGRGLWALEYLLFSERHAAEWASSSTLRDYGRELSQNVLGYATRLSAQLGDAKRFAAEFAQGDQASVDALVTQIADTLEVVRGKLERVSRALREHTPLENALEGFHSQSSTAVATALVVGSQRLYRGGLNELVAQVAPEVDARARQGFDRLVTTLAALPPTLDAAVTTRADAFHAVETALRDLQHLFKAELTSALEA
jgi:predicted lipoprotein